MNRLLKTLTIIGLLAVTAHRLPAPISEPTPEETKAKPQTAPAKHKSTEPAESNSARRFDGTWKGTSVNKTPNAVATYSFTLIIKDGKTADMTVETTCTLERGGSWSDLPEAYKHLSPIYFKATNHADHLVAAGSDLMIPWSGGRLIDWAPKTLPLEVAQKFTAAVTANEQPTAFALKGDALAVDKLIYHRVK